MRVDEHRGSHALRGLELLRVDVDRDDRRGARDASGLDAVEADAAAPPHGDARPGLHLRRVHDRAETGDDRAAEERSDVERDVAADGNGDGLWDDGVPGERRDRVEVVQLLAVGAQPTGPVRERPSRRHPAAELAEVAPAFAARTATAARGNEREHDVVASLQALDPVPHFADDPRRFVAEDDRQRLREIAVDHVHVACTHAAGGHLDQHLSGLRRSKLDLANVDGLARAPEDGCLRLHAGEPT